MLVRSGVAQYVPSVPGFDQRRLTAPVQWIRCPGDAYVIWVTWHLENPHGKSRWKIHFFPLPYLNWWKIQWKASNPPGSPWSFAPRCSTCGSCRLGTTELDLWTRGDSHGCPCLIGPSTTGYVCLGYSFEELRPSKRETLVSSYLFVSFFGCSNHFKAICLGRRTSNHSNHMLFWHPIWQRNATTPRPLRVFSRHVIPLRTSKITFAPASFKAVANCSDDHTGTASRAVSVCSPSSLLAQLALVKPPNIAFLHWYFKDTTNHFIHLSASVDYVPMDKWLMYWQIGQIVLTNWSMNWGLLDLMFPSRLQHVHPLPSPGVKHQTLILRSSNYPLLIH